MRSALRELRDTCLAGMRANLLPGAALLIVGLVAVFAYFHLESVRPVFEKVAALKARWGFFYSALATALFAGLIPLIYLIASRALARSEWVSTAMFYLIFWSTRGIEVDAFYRLQGWLFGQENDVRTIATKVLVDQFIYCPFWAAPFTALCYSFRECSYSPRRLIAEVKSRSFLFRVASLLTSTWIVWIPATALIYSLPGPLQIPLFNLVLCFFVLIVAVLTDRKKPQ
ncbi:MAG: hypothetical protein AAF236_07575 [Verrucomicrobiota bacterium]